MSEKINFAKFDEFLVQTFELEKAFLPKYSRPNGEHFRNCHLFDWILIWVLSNSTWNNNIPDVFVVFALLSKPHENASAEAKNYGWKKGKKNNERAHRKWFAFKQKVGLS